MIAFNDFIQHSHFAPCKLVGGRDCGRKHAVSVTLFFFVDVLGAENKIIKAFIAVLSYSMRHFCSAVLPSGDVDRGFLRTDNSALRIHQNARNGPHFSLFDVRREKGGISLAPIKAVLTEQPLFPKSVNDTNRQERETRRMDSAERTLSILQPVNGSFRSSITFFFYEFCFRTTLARSVELAGES